MPEHLVLQINVAGSNWRTHCLLNDDMYSKFDIIAIQDPWWGRIGSVKDTNPNNHDIYGTVNSPLWECAIPPSHITNKGPGVSIYTRCTAHLTVQFSDIISTHKDIIALDIYYNSGSNCCTIVNCYPHGPSKNPTIDAISDIAVPTDHPVVFCGEFNSHHPEWALAGSKWESRKPNKLDQSLFNFIDAHELYIMNNTTSPTHIAPNSKYADSIIDLTFVNRFVIEWFEEFEWEVEGPDSGKSLGSDHMAITWRILDYLETSASLVPPPDEFLIDPDCEDDWIEKFVEIISNSLNLEDIQLVLEEDLDNVAGIILAAMNEATADTMLTCNKNPKKRKRSPWWNNDCSKALGQFKHNEDNLSVEQLRAHLRGTIRRARREHADKICLIINANNVFETLKWFAGKRRHIMAPIRTAYGHAISPQQKAEAFGCQFFPLTSSPHISLEPLGITASPKREFVPISEDETRAALSKSSNKSAPGAFGTNYRLLRWAVFASFDLFLSFFNACLRIGYHPSCLRNAIISPIPKPRRTNMSVAKNYRPIALLETLSKLLEKIIATRLIFEVGKHSLIPQAQFGGRDITSCTDAGLCMVHDVKKSWAQGKVATLLTLDVSGYFNNVDHSRLIYTLDRLGFDNNTCAWLRSYLSNRSAQFRIDGIVCPAFTLPPVGIPQGSPLSPILSSIYSIPLLLASDHPLPHSFAYIDDFTILARSHSLDENITIMKESARNINNIAIKLGLSFEFPKSNLFHFPRPFHPVKSLPSIDFLDNNNIVNIHPSHSIRWLGFYLDQKLSFKEHVKNMANRAKAVISGLQMLANSVRGLSVRHTRILFKSCILPIISYGSPLWFHGHNQGLLLKPLVNIQNQGIRWILGALPTTPVCAMENIASIPPLHIHLRKINDNIATKLRSRPISGEVPQRLPNDWDSHDPRLIPTSGAPVTSAAYTKSPIGIIAEHSHPHAEFITPYLVHPSEGANPFPNQLIISHDGDGVKADVYAERLKGIISGHDNSPTSIIGYSDGHAGVVRGCSKVSLGYVITHSRSPIHKFNANIGPKANIFDAEMLSLAACLNTAVKTAIEKCAPDIVIYCDSQSAIRSISSLSPHPAQYASRLFRAAVHNFLANHSERSIQIQWIPGHKGFRGNKMANWLAKAGASLAPTPLFNCTATWLKHQATTRAKNSWNNIWARYVRDKPDSDSTRYIVAALSLKLRQFFNNSKLSRELSSRVVQFLTGHGWYGVYINRFYPDKAGQCRCGETLETINHVLYHCPKTEDHRHILTDISPNLLDKELFGSTKGLETIAKFISAANIGKPH